MEYDIIGDIHGNARALKRLLAKLGYNQSRGSWSSPADRQILFVGDFIDRGDCQMEVVEIVRSLMESGRALAVMGNHELNAIAWHKGYRKDTPKNRRQHGAFLDQVGERSDKHADLVEWFSTLPLWLDLPELRIVHACWDARSIEFLEGFMGNACLSEDLIERATVGQSNAIDSKGKQPTEHPAFLAVETILKGIELALPEGFSFRDKDNHERRHVRLKWWKQHPASFSDVSMAPLGASELLEAKVPEGILPGYDNLKPLFVGHYWMTGEPRLLSEKIACVDYSAGRGCPLVGYRWRGEERLMSESFVQSK